VIPDTLSELTVPVTDLRPYGRNPRRGDVAAIRRSLEAHGQYRPLVVNRRTGEVLAGNHTLAAALELGWSDVAVTYVDVDDDQAARIVLVDNRTNDLATYDDQTLAELLTTLPNLEATGYGMADLDRLLNRLGQGEPGRDTDPIGPPANPVTKLGSVWELGEHRLACGDATDRAVHQQLKDIPHLLITDPPYGVTYASIGRTYAGPGKQHEAIHNDSLTPEATRDLFADMLKASLLEPGGAFYVTVPGGPLLRWFMEAVDLGLGDGALRQVLVWVKDSLVMGRGDYHYRHEPILYGWRPGAGHTWMGDRKQDSVWEIARPKRSDEHPTMKPVDLYERALRNTTGLGQVVLDPFAGSGTCAIAAENLGRKAIMIELHPGYCDVIVDRWQRHTGREAQRAA
jgi:DNA modification methylase